MRESGCLEWIINTLIRDCLAPIILAFILWITDWRPFWEAALFLCLCQVVTNLFIEHCDFGKFKHRLARKIIGPILAPGIALQAFNIIQATEIAPNLNQIAIGDAWLHYWVFLFYRVLIAFGEPVLDLMLYGPVDRSLRKELKIKIHEFATRWRRPDDKNNPQV
ncbi:hypothetical protein ACFL54_07420 [Planctomycetota bacterium]